MAGTMCAVNRLQCPGAVADPCGIGFCEYRGPHRPKWFVDVTWTNALLRSDFRDVASRSNICFFSLRRFDRFDYWNDIFAAGKHLDPVQHVRVKFVHIDWMPVNMEIVKIEVPIWRKMLTAVKPIIVWGYEWLYKQRIWRENMFIIRWLPRPVIKMVRGVRVLDVPAP